MHVWFSLIGFSTLLIRQHHLVDFINRHRSRGAVYVHCKIGYSRSAAIVGAWLLEQGLATTADEAEAQLRAVRPTVVIRPEIRQLLRELAAA